MRNYNPYRYNRYRKLPKAETGMNVRGARDQVAKQEVRDTSVGSWFKDAGKWMLNMAMSPLELISGTNFYDPEMSHSGWQEANDVTEGVGKGVGDALGYVYGGPMYAAAKEGISGIADAAGAEDAIRGTQNGGRILKAQDSQTLPGTNQLNLGFPNGPAGAAQMGQINQGVNGVMNGTQHFCQGGNCPPPTAGGQTPMGSPGGGGQTPQMPGGAAGGAQQPQKPNPYLSDPNGDQGWATAVGEAASDPVGAITNMVGGIATAGDNPIHAEDYGAYIDAAANTGSHPGDLFNLWGNIGEGTTPVTAKINRENKAKSDGYANAKQGMQGIMKQRGGRVYQMGGTMEDPYMRSAAIASRTNQQGGRDQTALKFGQAAQATGNVVGESLSGMGMGGGGGGGMMDMLGGGGGGGGGMMDMLGGGGEGGGMMNMMGGGQDGGGNPMAMMGGNEGGGGMMDIFGGMMGGGEGGGDMMGMLGGLMGQNGGRVPVRKGKSPYIATHYYQDGTEVRPAPRDQMVKVDRSQVSADTIRKSNAQQMQNFGKPNITRTSPVTEQERLDAMMNANSDASRLMNSLGGGLPEPNMEMRNQHRMNEIDSLGATYQGSNEDFLNQGVSNEDFLNQPFQYGGRMPKAQDSLEIPARRTDRDGREYGTGFRKEREELEKRLLKPYTEGDMEYIKRWEQQYERQHEPFNEYMEFEIPSFKEELPVDSIPMYVQNGGRIPKAQMGGGLMDMLGKAPGMDMIQKLMGGLGGGGGQGGGGIDLSSISPEQMQAMQGMFKDGFSAEGLGNAIGGEQGKGIGDIVGGFMGGGGGGAAKQNGGRLEKTSNLPMDMEGFTDLEPGFNRSNTIEINSGNNHSDLNNPHTPLNVPVPSFDEQGNAMTENVQILAEKGEFARKDPETEAVTIFSKNLKTTGSSGKRTNYAKIAEKLGKKEDRLMEQAKNPFDDIKDASIQRALSNVKNKFIRLEEEQKVAKEFKEEEDRMDLMQLAKNGGRITKKNTYKVPGRKTSKVLSEYQKDLLGMDDQGQMPMAQDSLELDYTVTPEEPVDPLKELYLELFPIKKKREEFSKDPGRYNLEREESLDELESEEGNSFKKKRKTKAEKQKEREERKRKNKEWKEGGKEASRKELEEDAKAIQKEDEKIDARAAKLDAGEALKEYSDIGDGVNREYADKEDPGQYDLTPSELAKQIKELPGGGSEKVLDPYTNEGARKAKELIENEYGPLDTKGGLPCPPCEDGSIPSRDSEGNCLDCYSLAPEDEEETDEQQPQQKQQQRGASGDKAINDYINNLRGINADVEAGLTPYQNYFEDYGRETENIMRNTANDLPRYYEDRAAHLNAANVNAAENQVRNMSGMGTSGYLANMQALKNKELRANNDFLAQSQGQEDARLGKYAEMVGQHRQVEAEGATVADDRTREAQDALNAAKYDTEKNILTGRLAQTREENAARRNELLDSQMQWMYNNDRTQYDKDGNPVNPGPATAQYGGKIKRDMYEYGSRVKREKQMKSDRAMNDFRSFMSDYNKK